MPTAAPACRRSSPSATARDSAARTRRSPRARWPPPRSRRSRPAIAAPREAARDALRRAARFQDGALADVRGAAVDPRAIDDDAVVCRCEEVTAGELRRLIAAGHDSPAALKRAGRVGMGRCQGRYCASTVARMTSGGSRRVRPVRAAPAGQPVPIRALAVEQPEWTGHTDFVPPDMARPREHRAVADRAVDTLVIGGGVAGSCLAYWLAREGIEAAGGRARRREPAGLRRQRRSLHVQLPGLRLRASRTPADNRAADTLPLGPASMALWQEIAARHRRGSRDEGLRRADAGRERTRYRIPQGQDRPGEKPRYRGGAYQAPTSCARSSPASATSPSPPNGARARARSIH